MNSEGQQPQPTIIQAEKSQPPRKPLKIDWKSVGTIAAVLLAALTFFFGSGLFLRPRISVSCAAVNLNLPLKFQAEMTNYRMLFMAPKELNDFTNYLFSTLRQMGFPEDKLKHALDTNSTVKLEPYEERMVGLAISRTVNSWGTSTLKTIVPELPDKVMFFDIRNTGWRAAKDAHVVIRLDGVIYDELLDTDNKFVQATNISNQRVLDFAAIAPKSRTQGFIWYSSGTPDPVLYTNEISVTYDENTVRQVFTENRFILNAK